MLLTFNRGQVISIAPSGHYRASPRADDLLVYVVETPDGQETLSRAQFAERFGWTNNVGWATHLPLPPDPQAGAPGRGEGGLQRKTAGYTDGKSASGTTHPHPNPLPEGEGTLGHLALVRHPAALPGVQSWTIAPRSPPHVNQQWQPISLSPDAKWLAHAGQDGAVRLIDAARGEVERLFVGHDDPLAAVAFSPDGKLVAALDGVRGNVRIWNVATGRQTLDAHPGHGWVDGTLHWSPDGSLLAISVALSPLRLLDVSRGEFLPQPAGHEHLTDPDYFAWSPDGRRFVSAIGYEMRIWDTTTLEGVVSLESMFTPQHVAFGWSPDGATLAANAADGEIRVWNPTTGKLLKKLKEEHGSYYARMAWLPDSKRVVISTGGSQVARIWDLEAGKALGEVTPVGRVPFIFGLCASADGQTLALEANTSIGLFNTSSRALVKEVSPLEWPSGTAWSPDGRELAVAGDDMALWSNNKQRGLATLPSGLHVGAAWLPDGNTILNPHRPSGSRFDRKGRKWDAKPLKFDQAGDGYNMCSAVSPDGAQMALSNFNVKPEDAGKHRVEIWDIATGKRLAQTTPLGAWIHALAWSPDGALLAAGTDEGAAAIYDAATGERLAELPGARGTVRPIAFSPDGKTLAVGYGVYRNGFVRLHEVGGLKAAGRAEGTRRQAPGEEDGKAESDADRPHPGPLPEGEGVRADADGNPKPDAPPEQKADGTRSVPATLHELPCNGGPQVPEIVALHWSADGRRLKVLDHEGVHVFDTATGARLAEAPRLDRRRHGLRPANFSPDGRFLAVATTCTRVWDLAELDAAAETSVGSGLRAVPPSVAAPTAGRNDKETRGQGDKGNVDAPSNPKSQIQNPKLKLVASVVPLGHGQWMVVSADGHWLGTRGAEKEIVYVIQTAAGQETLTPREFYKRFGWKNDPNKVVLPE